MHDGRITSEAEFIRDVSGSETGVEGGMTTVNTDLYTPEVVLQLDEECPQYAHSGTPEVVRNSAVGRRDVNEVIDEVKEETVCLKAEPGQGDHLIRPVHTEMCSRCTRSTK